MLPARHRIAFTVDLDENDLTLENAAQNDEKGTGNVVATAMAAGNAARKMHNNCSAQLTVPSHQNHPNNRQIEVAKCEMAEVRWRQPCFDLIFYHTYPPHRGSKHHAKHHAKEKRHHHHHTMHHQHHRSHVVSQWRSIRASDRCHLIVVTRCEREISRWWPFDQFRFFFSFSFNIWERIIRIDFEHVSMLETFSRGWWIRI